MTLPIIAYQRPRRLRRPGADRDGLPGCYRSNTIKNSQIADKISGHLAPEHDGRITWHGLQTLT
jgi:hypothetical protein